MPDDSVKRYLTYHLVKLKSFFLSKDVLSFLVFLFLSATFWFLNTLNEERELTVNFQLVYKGIPADISFDDNLPVEMSVKMKDQGVNLWSYVVNRRRMVEVELNHTFREQGILGINTSMLRKAVSDLILPSTQIQIIAPENSAVKYNRLHARKVPVKLQATITPANQFMLNSILRVIPDSLVVYGSRAKLTGLVEIRTEPWVVNELKDTLSAELALIADDSLRFSISKVKVVASAEMFTEKVVNIPVQIINQPDELTVRSFPAEVRAVFNIAMSQFKNFRSGDIQVFIDYNDLANSTVEKRRLRVVSHQPYISNVRIKPEEVEFLLEEVK